MNERTKAKKEQEIGSHKIDDSQNEAKGKATPSQCEEIKTSGINPGYAVCAGPLQIPAPETAFRACRLKRRIRKVRLTSRIRCGFKAGRAVGLRKKTELKRAKVLYIV